jgi:hypothetical protein
MNPELANRIKAGTFVKIILKEDVSLSGYAGVDLENPSLFRLDAMVLGSSGYLEKVSLHLTEEDIASVQFLPQAPLFVDRDGNEITMEPGFFPEFS